MPVRVRKNSPLRVWPQRATVSIAGSGDVRAAVKEQVQSLGAKFLEVEGAADAEAAGGYARELTEEEQAKQAEALVVRKM